MPPVRSARGNRTAGRGTRARPPAQSRDSSPEPEPVAPARNRKGNRGRRAAPSPPPSPPPPVVESYWPTIRKHIENAAKNQPPLEAVCPICHDELPIQGLNPSDELLELESGVLIGCGHIFCRSCLQRSFKAQVDLGHTRTCPVCRLQMECDKCGLQSRMVDIAKQIDNANPNGYAALPRTVPEGGTKSDVCIRCDARGWWTFLVEQGRHGNEQDHIEAGFGRLVYDLMDEMEVQRVPCGIAEMEQALYGLLQRKFVELRRKRERYIETYLLGALAETPNAW